ncbi:MAG TPA: CapA family protein, partial [Actinomycetota bacterium]|nr:CapA family protein [Actinomycetota bacterium]
MCGQRGSRPGRWRHGLAGAAALLVVGLLAPSAWAIPRPETGSWNDRGPTYPERFSMAFTGDVLVHTDVWEQAAAYAGQGGRFDFRPMFAPIRPLISAADVAICHLETPVTSTDTHLSSFPVFNVPNEIVDAVAWAGYDGCSTASNHSLDQGLDGIRATIDELEEVHLLHAGTAATRRESQIVTMYRVGKARIAHLSYTFSFNGRTPRFGWEANRLVVSSVLAEARRARRAGADLTVVSLHWGAEYHHAPTSAQRSVAARLAGSGLVDLVVGHHAHVVQPVGVANGVPVVYGMGNELSAQRVEHLGSRSVEDGVIVWAVAERAGDGSYRVTKVLVTPTWVAPGSYRILPALSVADDPSTPAWLRAELLASHRRTMAEITALGGRPFGLRATRTPPLG